MMTLQFPLGVVQERPVCCRVVCFGGLWVISRVFGFFLVSGWALLWVVLGVLSWVLGSFCVFLCTKGRLYTFLMNLFLSIKKKKKKIVLSWSSKFLSFRFLHKHYKRQEGTILHTTALQERPPIYQQANKSTTQRDITQDNLK
jgi:hypothetical protein